MAGVIPGGISERMAMDSGGVPQGMFIQIADPKNPVLPFLHGGVVFPERHASQPT